jgi:hypothetical protein
MMLLPAVVVTDEMLVFWCSVWPRMIPSRRRQGLERRVVSPSWPDVEVRRVAL